MKGGLDQSVRVVCSFLFKKRNPLLALPVFRNKRNPLLALPVFRGARAARVAKKRIFQLANFSLKICAFVLLYF